MSSTLNAEIITPTSHFDLGEVEYLRLPGDEGLFGIKKNHAASLISLDVGEVKIIKNGQTEYWSTSGGILDLRNNNAQLLLETVEKSSEIDLDRATASVERAQKRLKDKTLNQARVQISLTKALNRLKVAKRS
tara:strand:+ start:45 stop:443 length:399 start_codon:yes stop_codon:yes gene_type:complete